MSKLETYFNQFIDKSIYDSEVNSMCYTYKIKCLQLFEKCLGFELN